MQWLQKRPFAHRGLFGGEVPENSLAAFEAAVRAGYGIELDVRLLADHEVVVFHDEDTLRLTGRPGSIHELTSAQAAGLKLANGQGLPLLSRVLELVEGRVPLYVEVKARGLPGPLEARVLALLAGYKGPFAVASFNPMSLGWFARHAPSFPRGQIASTFRGETDMSRRRRFYWRELAMTWMSRPAFVAYDLRGLPRHAVSRARRRGLPVLAWTVRNAEDLAKAQEVADNYVFESIRP